MSEKNLPPRVGVLEDLSCLGRCSLSVSLPVLAALGCQGVPMPTALLSTQTDGFKDIRSFDLTSGLSGIIDHFSSLDVKFDGFLTGFLAGRGQIALVEKAIDLLAAKNASVLVDPVLGDAGVLYPTVPHDLVGGMRELCSKATVITPNLTEALLLTGTSVDSLPPDEEALLAFCDDLLWKLASLGARDIVITGIPSGGDILTVGKEKDLPRFVCRVAARKGGYPGTGDIFAAILLGRLLSDETLAGAATFASEFIVSLIDDTAAAGTPVREGVLLEGAIGKLTQK